MEQDIAIKPMAAVRWSLHPFLASVYFVLSLAAANAIALQGFQDLLWPLGTVLAACGLCWALAWAWTRDSAKATLLSLLWMTAFSTYGYVSELVLPETSNIPGGKLVLLLLFALALLGPSLALRRTTRDLAPYNWYLSIVAVLLVGYTGVRLYSGLHRERNLGVLLPPPAVPQNRPELERPDIYLIILDKYTGGELLADHFGFDNGMFEQALRSRGFVVPRHARANYPQTQLALAGLLNVDYVHHLPSEVHLYDLIEHNRLVTFLQREGYRFVFFPSAFKFTSQNRHADLQLPSPTEIRGEFLAVWQRTTVLPELLDGLCATLGCQAGRLRYVPESAEFMDWKFARLSELGGGSRPVFAFAHLSLPHEPFVYAADCSHREPYWPTGAGVLGDREADAAYLDQITCVNRRVLTLVDAILERSQRPPVILLQADHGHGRLGRHLPEYQHVTPERLRERLSVFAAYHLPGVAAEAIGDSITPIGAMRFVLSRYFAADLPVMQDESYWATEDRPRDMVRVR